MHLPTQVLFFLLLNADGFVEFSTLLLQERVLPHELFIFMALQNQVSVLVE